MTSAPRRLDRLLRPLWIALAALFLFEGWLWDRLAAAIGRLAGLIALPALKARLTAVIQRLPPAATLLVFVVPLLLLLPVKLAGLWLLARGSWLGALAVLGAAKVISMGTTAFLFQVTRPKLLQMAWFRRLHDRVLAALAWARRQLDPVRARLRAGTLVLVTAWRRWLMRLTASRPQSRLLRRILRLRRRARTSASHGRV